MLHLYFVQEKWNLSYPRPQEKTPSLEILHVYEWSQILKSWQQSLQSLLSVKYIQFILLESYWFRENLVDAFFSLTK